MNRTVRNVILYTAAIALAFGLAVAGNSKLYVPDGVHVSGERLDGGEYFVEVESAGDGTVVVFKRGSTEMARSAAQWVELDRPAVRTTARLKSEDGKREIVAITFEGETRSLELVRG